MWQKGQAWRVVKGLNTLNENIRAYAPRSIPPATDVNSWGAMADNAHDSTSDHYPHYYSALGSTAVVCARDFPHAPKLGLDGGAVAEALRQSRDPRIGYVIFNRRVFSSTNAPWTWRTYNGSDPHDTHFHVSSVHSAVADSTAPWKMPNSAVLPTPEQLQEDEMQILVRGFGNTDVEKNQIWLADGMFRRAVPNSWVYVDNKVAGPITNSQTHQAGILGKLSWDGNVFVSGGNPDVWGIDIAKLGSTLDISTEQVEVLAAAVADELEPSLEDAAFKGAQRAEKE